MATSDPVDGGPDWEPPQAAKPATFGSPHKMAVDRNSARSQAKGKGRYDLITPSAIHRLALRLEEGAETHGDRAWENNNTPEGRARALESLLRHAFQVSNGEEDEDHLAAVMANAMFLIKFTEQQARVDRLAPVGPRVGG